MDFEIQAHALLPHLLFSAGYLGILFLARARRDALAVALLAVFCLVLGLRDIQAMSRDADPVLYAFILSYSSDVSSLMGGGVDYVLFSILHPITGAIFDLRECFLFLHLLYIPALFLLFKRLRQYPGVFYLMAGWMIFVNSGLLLLANFFRQGLCVLLFLAALVGVAVSADHKSRHRMGALCLPLLHASAIALLPNLLVLGRRRYLFISSISFLAFCLAAHFSPYLLDSPSDYFASTGMDVQRVQLEIKILTIYAMLLIGYFIGRRTTNTPDGAARIQRAAIGLLLPTASLLLLLDAPAIALRFLYFSYAVVFLYVALAVSLRKKEMLFKFSAIAICLFGFVTWTYPTVAVLLIW